MTSKKLRRLQRFGDDPNIVDDPGSESGEAQLQYRANSTLKENNFSFHLVLVVAQVHRSMERVMMDSPLDAINVSPTDVEVGLAYFQ